MAQGLAREGWDKDLPHGESRETAFVRALQSCHVEHKSDGKCRVTGNVFIEYEQKGRSSGIATTTAQWWAIEVDDDQWVVIRTALLKILVRKAIQDKRTRFGGDGNQYLGALIPVCSLVRRMRAA